MHPVHFVWKLRNVSEITTLHLVSPQWSLRPFWQNFCAPVPWHCSHTHQWLFAMSSACDLCSAWGMCVDSYNWHWPGLEGTIRNNGETTWVSGKKQKPNTSFSCNTAHLPHYNPDIIAPSFSTSGALFFLGSFCSLQVKSFLPLLSWLSPAESLLPAQCRNVASPSNDSCKIQLLMKAAELSLGGIQNSNVQGPEKPCLN